MASIFYRNIESALNFDKKNAHGELCSNLPLNRMGHHLGHVWSMSGAEAQKPLFIEHFGQMSRFTRFVAFGLKCRDLRVLPGQKKIGAKNEAAKLLVLFSLSVPNGA